MVTRTQTGLQRDLDIYRSLARLHNLWCLERRDPLSVHLGRRRSAYCLDLGAILPADRHRDDMS